MKIADDYVRTWCCYYVLIVKPAKKFYYLTLTSDINDHKTFKLEFKKFKERYFRKTGHTFFGQIEHNGRGKCYHVHLVFIPADESRFDYEKTKKDLTAVWTGTKAQLKKPFKPGEGNGPLGMMFYLCKAKKHDRYVKTKFGGQTNFVYCNVATEVPWAGYRLPSRERNRPKIINLVEGFFKLYRADPNKNQQARMPRFPSVHTDLLN